MSGQDRLSPQSAPCSRVLFDAQKYWEARLREYPRLCGVGHTDLGRSYVEWLYRVRRAVFLRIISTLKIDLGQTQVLDVGSGTGFYLELWKQAGVSDLAGCDFTEIAAVRLKNALPWARILQPGIGEALPSIEVGRYDIVSAFDGPFHIVEDKRYERAIRNVDAGLRAGGLFLFSGLLPPPASEQVALLEKTGFEIVCRAPRFVLMEQPLDSTSRLHRFLWKLMSYPVKRSEFVGFVIGAILYPLKLILAKLLAKGPSTEIVLCRKRRPEVLVDWAIGPVPVYKFLSSQ